MTNDEVVMSEQEESNHRITKNIKHFEEKDDVDEWLNAEITKHMNRRGLVKRWHVYKPVHVTYNDGNGEDCGMWPTCDPGPQILLLDIMKSVRISMTQHENEGTKGCSLDDVWEKCQQNYKKTNEAWHDEGYEEDKLRQSRDEKTDYDPPYVNVKTFKVKKYSFKGGRSFIYITDRKDEALPLGRMNRARFKAMIRKELDANKYVHEVT
ncbi:hypothetical protein Tco_1214992 [Tanacetum coccineum]